MAQHHPRRDRSTSVWSLVIVFVLLGGLSLTAGYFGGQYLLRGFIGAPSEPESPDEPPEDEPAVTVFVTGDGLSLYRVQAGAYEERGNAETRRAELHDMGYPAAVVSLHDGMHRVIVDVSSSEQGAREAAAAVDAASPEALAAPWVIPSFSRQMTVSSEMGDGLQDLVTALVDLLLAEAATSDEDDLRDRAGNVNELWQQVKAGDGAVPDEFRILMDEFVVPHLDALERDVGSRESRETFIHVLYFLAEMGIDGG
ncbi:MAG: SPOR domain-containing protein [Bacillota bacterium]